MDAEHHETDDTSSAVPAPRTATSEPEETIDVMTALRSLQVRQRAYQLSLACGPGFDAGDISAGVDACYAARAAPSCRFVAAQFCPRTQERQASLGLLARLERARIPGHVELAEAFARGRWVEPGPEPSLAELLLGTIGGRRHRDGSRVLPRALLDTGPLRLVAAFLAGAAVGVDVGGRRPVQLHGQEWVIFLGGEVGCGKSAAAASAILYREDALFATAPELCTVNDDAKLLRAQAGEARLLLLDDLGMEQAGAAKWEIGMLAELLARRHGERRPTIVTTNLDRAALGERYGARIADRLREGARLVGFPGPSLRGRRPA